MHETLLRFVWSAEMISILAAGLILLTSPHVSASFYALHQEGLRLHLARYALTSSGIAARPAAEYVVTLDMGEAKPEDWSLYGAVRSPDGRWLAVQETGHARLVRGLVMLNMTRMRQSWHKMEEGYWSGGGWIRWTTSDHISVAREQVIHPSEGESTARYGLDTYAAPDGRSVAQGKAWAEDRWEVLLPSKAADRRRGAAKLLSFLGYSPPLRRESAGTDTLLDYLNGEQGAVAEDGKAVACLVFQRPRVWSLDRSRLYHNAFVWAWRSSRRGARSGWQVWTVPLDVEAKEYPHGVWLWKPWLVVAAGVPTDQARLFFFRRGDLRHRSMVPGNVFIPDR